MLREAGYRFEVRPAPQEQMPAQAMLPAELALHLAVCKAQAVAQEASDCVVLGADTVVAFGDRALGKPVDAEDARRMLALLSRTTQIVITGVCVVHSAGRVDLRRTVMSAVRMRPLRATEIEAYVASRQWEGKAGGYGIQDPDPFVTRMTGSHSNIVGLPMEAVGEMLGQAGVRPEQG